MTQSRSRSRAVSSVLVIVFAAVAGLGLTLTASRASAVFTEITETGTPGYITLSRDTATPLWATLEPGQSTHWRIRASLESATSGSLAIELRGSGDLIDDAGLTGSVDACAGAFDLASLQCSGVATSAVSTVALRDLPTVGDRIQLADIEQGAPREFLVTLTLPADAVIAEGASQTARVGLGVHASGDTVSPTTPTPAKPAAPQLTLTGADLLPLGVLAVGLVGLGAALVMRRRAAR
ncbi:hypothetical protein ACXR2W_11470 [Leucobacter sp. HY1908]